MAKSKADYNKDQSPGNVIYTRQNMFYDQIFSIHGDLVRKGAEIDERNIGFYVDFLNSFVSGYNDYIPEKDDIKEKIKELRKELMKEEYLKRTFTILREGILSLSSSEFVKYKQTMNELKEKVFDIFDQICANLPRKNVFPKGVEETTNDDMYFS